MTTLEAGTRLKSLANGSVIQILATGTDKATIATVAEDGRLLKKRQILSTSLRTNPYGAKGRLLKTGYVITSALPAQAEDTVTAKVEDTTEAAPTYERKHMVDPTADDVDYSALDDDTLAAYIKEAEGKKKAYEGLAEKAKTEMGKRTAEPGLRLFGDVAVNAALNRRFDPALAKKKLTPKQLAAISVLKPDADLAKALLGEKSDAYKSILKDHGWRLTVRFATDDDLETIELQQRKKELEAFQPGDAIDTGAPF